MKSLYERREVSAIIVRYVARLLLKRYREDKSPREAERRHDRDNECKEENGTDDRKEQIILLASQLQLLR